VTVAVGYLAGKGGRSPLYLAAEAAKTLKTSLTVVTVVPRPWMTPSIARIDAEYAQYADQLAADSAKQAEFLENHAPGNDGKEEKQSQNGAGNPTCLFKNAAEVSGKGCNQEK